MIMVACPICLDYINDGPEPCAALPCAHVCHLLPLDCCEPVAHWRCPMRCHLNFPRPDNRAEVEDDLSQGLWLLILFGECACLRVCAYVCVCVCAYQTLRRDLYAPLVESSLSRTS